MKHLVGVMTYKMTRSLALLVELLSDEMDIVLNVDAKSELNQYDAIKKKVDFIEYRTPVFWGDFSQVEQMLAILEYGMREGYDYISLVSEADLPLKTAEQINNWLIENQGLEFIGFTGENDQIAIENVKYRYFPFYKKRGNLLRKIFKDFKLYKLFKNPYYKNLPKLYKGGTWFTLSSDAIVYIFNFLDKNPDYKKAFKDAYCSDEIFFHTILYNSPFRSSIYQIENPPVDDNEMGLRYIDWKTGPTLPTVLKAENLKEYQSAQPNSIFFRKVDESSNFEKYLQLLREI